MASVEMNADTLTKPPHTLTPTPSTPKQISCEIRKLRNVSELKMLALIMEA